ncbi:MAG: DUF3800 domain-containing protein [Desulfobacterales bacterium]|nr:DUF3800 domain-containing protein [Desulfobacterales bacterium]
MSRLYRLYIDESGDHTYFDVDKLEKRYLGLTGCIVEKEYYGDCFKPELETLKKNHFSYDPDDPPIFHRTDLINCRGPFWRLRDKEKRQPFNKDLLRYFREMNFTLITVVIDKKSHIDRYDKAAFHPYNYCLAAMLERYCGFLNFYNAKGDMMAESRGKIENELLASSYQMVYRRGTQWRGASFFNNVLTSEQMKIKPKTANVAGLQVADLLAYPMKQEILVEKGLLPDRSEAFSKTICEAVKRKHNQQVYQGRVSGYGKVFLE